MADWCVGTAQPPDVWRQLSRVERDEFEKAAKRLYGKR